MSKPCPKCGRPKYANKQACIWHWLLRQPPEIQVEHAGRRRDGHDGDLRPRVPATEWPAGERWCAGCQSYVPLFYTTGSRCRACASKAAHGSRLKAVYGITEEEYQALLAFQDGRCYVCARKALSKRLAVDHDHITGEVRGLLCADVERGCNHALLGNIEANKTAEEALAMARRIVAYLEYPPMRRLRDGEAPAQGPGNAVSVDDDLGRALARLGSLGSSMARQV